MESEGSAIDNEGSAMDNEGSAIDNEENGLITSTPVKPASAQNSSSEESPSRESILQHGTFYLMACQSYSGLRRTCCGCQATEHPNITIFVVFLAIMIDVILMTAIEPILPDMMLDMDSQPNRIIGDHFITPPLNKTNISSSENLLTKYSVKIAVLVGLKSGLEVVFNIAVGFLVDRVGHFLPMMLGCGFNLVATLAFAYFKNFYLLILSRAFQAIGSSLSVVSGLALLAASFPDSQSRSVATSKAFSGVSFGVGGGYALGSILYQFCGIECPFLIIAALNILDLVIRVSLLSPYSSGSWVTSDLRETGNILADLHIVAGLSIVFMQNISLGIFLATGPSWMLFQVNAEQWQLGVILSISAVVYVIVQNVTARVANRWGQWKFMLVGLLFIAGGTALYPIISTPWEMLLPEIVTRIGHGMLVACVNPILCHLVDKRHGSRYGLINGLYTASYNLGLFAGPLIGGALLKVIPFKWLYWGLALLVAIFSLVSLSWRSVCEREPLDLLSNDSGHVSLSSAKGE